MAITDEQYDAWTRTDAPRVVLLELKYGVEAGGARAERTLYFASKPYQADGRRYRAVMTKAPTITFSIEGSRSRIHESEAVLDNRDGSLDFLERLAIDGYEAAFYVGAPMDTPGWSRSDFRCVGLAFGRRVRSSGDGEIVVEFAERRLLLDRAVQGSQVGGTGPEATRYLPLMFGSQFNCDAVPYDPATLIYSWASNAAGGHVQDVRDNGLSLTKSPLSISSSTLSVDPATDVLTRASHALSVNDAVYFEENFTFFWSPFAPFPGMTAGVWYWVTSVPSANTFTLSATKGGTNVDVTGATWGGDGTAVGWQMRVQRWAFNSTTGRVQLSSTPAGTVTLDGYGIPSPANTPFGFAKYLIETYGNGTAVDAAAFTAADGALGAKVGIGYMAYAIRDRSNLLDVLDDFMAACFGWYGLDTSGLVTCGLFDVSGIRATVASRTLVESQMLAPLDLENLPVGYGRVNVELNTNNRVQSDGLAAAVTVENRARYAAPYLELQRSAAPSGTTYAGNKPLYHKTMIEQGPTRRVELSSFSYNTDVARSFPFYADEIVADQAPHLQHMRTRRDLAGWRWRPGQIVRVSHSRHNLAGGDNALILSTSLDLNNFTIDLAMLRQVTPDVSDTAHP